MRGRTTILIAHRLSTAMHCDSIAVLEGGKVVEQGSHAALIERKGKYAEMWAAQQTARGTSKGEKGEKGATAGVSGVGTNPELEEV